MPTIYGPDVDVYLTITEWSRWGIGDELSLLARVTTTTTYVPNDSNEHSGYCLTMYEDSTNVMFVFLNRMDASLGVSDRTSISTGLTVAVSNGDKFGLRVAGSTIQSWHKPVAGSWTLLESVTDTTYSTAGFTGFYLPCNFTNNTETDPGYYNDYGAGTATGGSFPTTSVVDSFVRADAATLGSNWEKFADHNSVYPYNADGACIAGNRASVDPFTLASADYYMYAWAGGAATPVYLPVPSNSPQAINTCNPQTTVSNGGKGNAGCNTGGVGWTRSYTGPWGTVPQHTDPTDGELLTGKESKGIEAWIELKHVDYPSEAVTTYRRAMIPLAHHPDKDGYKTDGLLAIGDVEHALGNEEGGLEATTINLELTDVRDRLLRNLLLDQELEGDELYIKLSSDPASEDAA